MMFLEYDWFSIRVGILMWLEFMSCLFDMESWYRNFDREWLGSLIVCLIENGYEVWLFVVLLWF